MRWSQKNVGAFPRFPIEKKLRSNIFVSVESVAWNLHSRIQNGCRSLSWPAWKASSKQFEFWIKKRKSLSWVVHKWCHWIDELDLKRFTWRFSERPPKSGVHYKKLKNKSLIAASAQIRLTVQENWVCYIEQYKIIVRTIPLNIFPCPKTIHLVSLTRQKREKFLRNDLYDKKWKRR